MFFFFPKENPYPAVTMHRVQRTAESAQPRLPQTTFPQLDEVSVQLFIDHATAKLRTAPPVVKAELKRMVPTGPPLGESAIPCDFCDVKTCGLNRGIQS